MMTENIATHWIWSVGMITINSLSLSLSALFNMEMRDRNAGDANW